MNFRYVLLTFVLGTRSIFVVQTIVELLIEWRLQLLQIKGLLLQKYKLLVTNLKNNSSYFQKMVRMQEELEA